MFLVRKSPHTADSHHVSGVKVIWLAQRFQLHMKSDNVISLESTFSTCPWHTHVFYDSYARTTNLRRSHQLPPTKSQHDIKLPSQRSSSRKRITKASCQPSDLLFFLHYLLAKPLPSLLPISLSRLLDLFSLTIATMIPPDRMAVSFPKFLVSIRIWMKWSSTDLLFSIFFRNAPLQRLRP